MEKTRKTKVSLALDPKVVENLDYLTKRLGVSRSAMVSELLAEALPAMVEVFRMVPEAPTAQDVVRFRGESAKVVQERMEQLKRVHPDLFLGAPHD